MKGIIRIGSGDIPTFHLVFDEKNKVMFCYLRFLLVFFSLWGIDAVLLFSFFVLYSWILFSLTNNSTNAIICTGTATETWKVSGQMCARLSVKYTSGAHHETRITKAYKFQSGFKFVFTFSSWVDAFIFFTYFLILKVFWCN